MATTYQLKTFLDLITAVQEEMKYQSSDTVSLNRIRRDINIVYTTEIIPKNQWKWLRGYVNLTIPPKLTAGTASVAQGSRTVTLSSAPATSQKGANFAVIGFNEIYRVAQHTANSTTLVLDAAFNGSTAATQSYQLWSDRLPLPSDLRETFEVTQDFNPAPLEGCGLQKFRKYVNPLPFAEGYPQYYTTGNFVDPNPYIAYVGLPSLSTRSSNGLVKTLTYSSSIAAIVSVGDRIEVSSAGIDSYNGQFVVSTVSGSSLTYTGLLSYSESATADSSLTVQIQDNVTDVERYKQIWIYPSINTSQTTLHVDYIKEVLPLTNDSDEPLMPVSDRVVLLYGALARAWARERDPEEAARNTQLYLNKLTAMTGKLDDSVDMPTLRPSRPYLRTKRSSQRFQEKSGYWGGNSLSGSSGAQVVQGPSNTVPYFNGSGQLTNVPSGANGTVLQYVSGIPVFSTVGSASFSAGAIPYSALTLTNKIVNADINSAAAIAYSKLNLATSILDSDVNSAAAIAYSKLNLASSIKNSDVISTAAIAYSKLNLASSITNTDVISTAAISYSKLNLAGSITNSDVISTAAIAYSKLSLGLSILNSDINSAAAIAYSKLNLSASIANSDIISTAAITYSKLSLANSIVNNDIATAAAIARTKIANGTNFAWQANNSAGTLTDYALTASRAVVTDANGLPSSSTVTSTELGFVSGVTSSIQGQINTINSSSAAGLPEYMNNISISATVSTNAMTLTMLDKTGSALTSANTASINFRSSTATVNTFSNVATVSAGPTLVIPSGATLGQTNAVPANLYIYAINNGGTIELAVAGEKYQNTNQIVSSSVISSGSSSNATLYSTTARTNVAARLLAVLNNTQTTAGTWASAGNSINNTQTGSPRTTDNSLIGVTDGSSAIAGVPGEVLAGQSSGVVSISGATNIAQVNLTAGRWLVGGTGQFIANSSTFTFAGNNWTFDLTTTTAGSGTASTNSQCYLNLQGVSGTVTSVSGSVFGLVANITATTTYFLVFNPGAAITGTAKAVGDIWALRIG